ncbi:RNA polymerase sigma factor [Phenylobacterium montanum]|uniref:RNA polymerase subunit sigma-24 n=1 Tax=Phenylobacterium montanum TaxID=2823693 RepID=A0A975IWR7_9CAUL|nr:DUF6596 domain-containing protein [Caulobacter sp. S6]QUD88651.1 RNA polymerase subunit sigma-24 [Caulobacter sp. S6]
MARAPQAAAEAAARNSYGRLLAYLAARSGDLVAAEDALGDAFAAALAQWPDRGAPDNPDAWLLAVARRRLADQHRARGMAAAAEPHLVLMREEIEAAAAEPAVPDRRLALMFACAGPEVDPSVRAPLMLQAVLGLTAAEIGSAFLVPPGTMGQRLSRSKARLREAGRPFTSPPLEAWPERLGDVLQAIYAAFAKGWRELGEPEGEALATEAVWLGRLLTALMPGEGEAEGLLALMLYAEARRPARRCPAGDYAPLEAQDVARWDQAMLAEAEAVLSRASARPGASGRFQIEAAIQSAHIARRLSGLDTWPDILALYDLLRRLAPSPVVELNRALVLARIEGPEVGLAALRCLNDDRRIADYQPYWAALGRLSAETGQVAQAIEALILACGLSDDPAERRYLEGEIAQAKAAGMQ